MKKFVLKPQIIYERGSIKYLNHIRARKVLVVTDKDMVKFGLVKKITEILDKRNISYSIFSEVHPNPSINLVSKGLEYMVKVNPDVIIALGGGSPIDTAKGILLLYTTLLKKENTTNVEKPYFITVPTTSGTGSEVTAYSVINDEEKNIKKVFNEEVMLPDLAVIDLDFTVTVPPVVTADTGLDVLTHALEAFVSKDSSDYTDVLAEGVIKIVFNYLLSAYRDGKNILARDKMHNASCLAGIAFTNSSLGINHSMAHILGTQFKLSHGRSNAILLPYVIKYNSEIENSKVENNICAKKYRYIAESIGIPTANIREGVSRLIEAIKVLNRKLDIPLSIKETGIDGKSFLDSLESMSEIAIQDICTEGNPKVPTKEHIISIFKKAYIGE